MRYSLRSMLLFLLVAALASFLATCSPEEPSEDAKVNFEQDDYLKELLVEDLPVILNKFELDKFNQIHKGQTQEEVVHILGKPCDTGTNSKIIQKEATGNAELEQQPLFYQRYRYLDDKMIVLLFNKESKKLVHMRVHSWTRVKRTF